MSKINDVLLPLTCNISVSSNTVQSQDELTSPDPQCQESSEGCQQCFGQKLEGILPLDQQADQSL